MSDQETGHEGLSNNRVGQGVPSAAVVSSAAPAEAADHQFREGSYRAPAITDSHRRLREMTLLYHISTLIASAVDMNSALRVVCQELAAFLEVPQAGFALLDGERTAAEVIADVHPANTPPALGARIPVAGNPSMAYILAHKAPLAVSDAQADPRLLPVHGLMHDRQVRSILIVPMVVEGDVIGTLGFDAFEPRHFTQADVELVQHVANQAGQLLMRKRAEAERNRRVQELEALQATVLDITVPHDLPTLLQTIVERAARLLDAPAGGLYLCEPAQECVRCAVSYNTPSDYCGIVLAYGEGAAGLVARRGKPLIVDDYRTWEGRAAPYREETAFRAVLAVPMIWQGAVTGVIDLVHFDKAKRFTAADAELLALFANHAAIAVENTRLYEQAQREIAERAETQEALRSSEAQYRVTLDSLGDAIHVIDSSGRIVLFNNAFRSWNEELGLDADVVGKSPLEVFPFLPPQVAEEYDRVFQTGRLLVTEERVRFQDRDYITETRKIPVLADGRVVQVITTVRNVTSRRRAQEEIRRLKEFNEAIVTNMSEGIALLDAAGTFTFVNPAAAAMLGYATADLVGRHLISVIPPDQSQPILAEADRGTPGQSRHYELELAGYDGGRLPVLVSTTPRFDPHRQEFVGTLAVFTDIRERKRVEAQRDASLEALHKANRRLRMLGECNEALSRAREESDLLLKVCEIASEIGGYRFAWVGYAEGDEAGRVRPVAQAGRGEGDLARLAITRAGSMPDGEHVAAALRTRRTVVARGLPASPDDALSLQEAPVLGQDSPAAGGSLSLVALPLLSGDQCLGALAVYAGEPDAFDSEEIDLLTELADNLAFGILALRARAERRWAEQVTRRYAERLEILHRIDRAILEAQSPEAIARATLERIEHLLPCRQASISVFGSHADRPTILASHLPGDARADLASALEELETAAEFRRGKAHVISSDLPGPRLPRLRLAGSEATATGTPSRRRRRTSPAGQADDPPPADAEETLIPPHYLVAESGPPEHGLVPQGSRAALYIPLIAQGELIGALYLASDRNDAFHPEHIEIGYEVAAPLAVAIQHAHLNQQLQLHAGSLEETVTQRTRELKAERDRSQAILESLGEAVIVTDVQGKILYTNPAATALTGFLGDEMLGRDWPRLQDGGAGDRWDEAQTWLQAGDTWRGQVISRRKNDVLYDAAVTAAPLFDADDPGQLVGTVWVQRDITPLKEAERFKDRFVSNVSHELRTPLSIMTLVAGNLDRLYRQLDDDKRREMIGTLREQVALLSELVGDVLEISRIDSGRVSRERERLDLAALVRSEMDKQWPLAQRHSLSLLAAGLESLPITGNAGQLRQVVRNLLNNAIKFTPDGGQITCQCHIVSTGEELGPGWPGSPGLAAGSWAAVRVVDTGVGISREHLPHIFERFYRVRAEGDVPGTGLGLAITRELVELHGGHLAALSTLGQGSIFAFYLPLEGAAPAMQES